MTSFRFEPVFQSLGLTILLGIALLLTITLVGPPTADPRQRRWLILLRWTAAMLLLLVIARPSLVRTDTQPAESALLIAVDTSQSMTLSDGEARTRWQRQKQVWETLFAGLQPLSDRLNLKLVAYDGDAETVESPSGSTLAALNPDGNATNLSAPVDAAIDAASGQPVEGLILIGDGTGTIATTENADALPGASVDQAVAVLGSIGVPLWTIPIGPPKQSTVSRDAAVEGLAESYRLFTGTEFDLNVELALQGLAGTDLPIRVRWISDQGATIDAATRRIAADRAIQRTPIRFSIQTPPPGNYRLEVSAEVQSGEILTSNNSQVAFVDVLAGGGRVFYLEGQPRSEQFFLRLALQRFKDLNLRYQWIPADTRGSWPIDLGDDLSSSEHDVFILGDLDSAALSQQQWQTLADSVADGAALVTLGGLNAYAAGGYAATPLADVLPVRLPSAAPSADGRKQIQGPIRVRVSRPHPITDITTADADSVASWQSLPELAGASVLGTPKPIPGVQVLLENQNGDPLLVVGEYGRGRVASLAIDETFRWFRSGRQEFHARFWRQLILWSLSRDETEGNRIQIEMESRRFTAARPPRFEASLSLAGSVPTESPDWKAVITDGSGNTTNVVIDRQSGGEALRSTVGGVLPPDLSPGFYKLSLQTTLADVPPATIEFQVTSDNAEMSDPTADPVFLRQLADITADQGGRSFQPDRVEELIEMIRRSRQKNVTTVVSKARLGDGPLSGWIVFVLFAAALTLEWLLRRRWGLV